MIRLIIPLLLMVIAGTYQNCGSPLTSLTDKEDLSSEGSNEFSLQRIRIQLTEANVQSFSSQIQVSGICEGPDEMIAEVSWTLKKISCPTCSSSHTLTQSDGCINGELGFTETLPKSMSVESPSEDIYRVEVLLTPRNIPVWEISGDSFIEALVDNESSIKPVINGNLPGTKTVEVGSEYAINVRAEAPGNGSLTYQWFKNNKLIRDDETTTGQGTDTLTLKPVNLGHEAQYKVIIGLDRGGRVVSKILSLTVPRPIPELVEDLQATDIAEYRSPYSMTVEVLRKEGDTAEFTYQWFKDDKLIIGDGDRVAGQGTATLTLNPVELDDQGKYYVVIVITGGKKITSSTLTLTVPRPTPVITKNLPTTGAVDHNDSAAPYTMNVEARVSEGVSGTLTYQWFKDDDKIEDNSRMTGQGRDTFTISPVRPEDEGRYIVIVGLTLDGGGGGSVTSETLTLRVTSFHYHWVNIARDATPSHSVACGGDTLVAEDQGYGICASGERRPTQGEGHGDIIYHWLNRRHGGPQGGTIIRNGYCYNEGQKPDDDSTDKIVAFLCKRLQAND